MASSTAGRRDDAATARAAIPDRAPWRRLDAPDGARCWLSGYTSAASDESAAATLAAAAAQGEAALKAWARGTLCLGAAVVYGPAGLAAVSDVVAGTPLFLGTIAGAPAIAARASDLDRDAPDATALRQLAAAGFTIGARTQDAGVAALLPGQIVRMPIGGAPQISRWTRYLGAPDPARDPDDPAERRRHNDLLLQLLERLVRDAAGRPIVAPLSAGFDSRAILSGLKEIGAPNVTAFSYGLPGNHEAEGARKVAAKLGVPWEMVAYSHAGQRAFFQSKTAADFFAFADRPDAMPFMQDVPALERLIAADRLPKDAILVNGQSGDFIAGNHIPAALLDGWASLEGAFAAKHMAMWGRFRTPAFERELAGWLKAELPADQELSPAAAYELLEFESRQSKYVVAGQRAYEFFDRAWRLPLWEPEYVEFWRTAPLAAKRGRRLFVEALEEANWGGVWGPDWVFPRTVVPRWLRGPRLAAKLLAAPFGRARWHRLEKRVFDWWMDPVLNYAIKPYGAVLRDDRGFRNALALHNEAYLARCDWSVEAAARAAEVGEAAR